MLARKNQVIFRLSDVELAHFKEKVKKSGLSQEALIRLLLKDYSPKEKPDDEFYVFIRQLSAIGNNIHQLCRKANALNFIDAPTLKDALIRLDDFEAEIFKRFLDPDKVQ